MTQNEKVKNEAVLRLIPDPPGRIERGEIHFDGRDLLTLPRRDLRAVRGRDIAMIFQEPMTSLNPVFTVGQQIIEAIRLHRKASAREARTMAAEALTEVGIADASARLNEYPHHFSGGMRQRVMIAMALACRPRLLLADEPTTALDVTIQAQVLALLHELQRQRGLAIMLITHDLGVVAQNADVVAVMYAGRVVEYATVHELFRRPLHPYTRGLLKCRPRLDETRSRLVTVADVVGDAMSFTRIGSKGRSGIPWWPKAQGLTTRAEFAADHGMVEVEPSHWVRCWEVNEVDPIALRPPEIAWCRDAS